MLKEYKIKINDEYHREQLYKTISLYIEQNFAFDLDTDMDGFKQNVANKSKSIHILGVICGEMQMRDSINRVMLHVAFIGDNDFIIRQLHLIKPNLLYKLPTFKKGEK